MRILLYGLGTWAATVFLLFVVFFVFALTLGKAMPSLTQIALGVSVAAVLVVGVSIFYARSAAFANVGSTLKLIVMLLFSVVQLATFLLWLFFSMLGLNR